MNKEKENLTTLSDKELYIKEYIVKNNPLFVISKIDQIRDGGTIAIFSYSLNQQPIFYIHKDNLTLHNGYPNTNDNMVIDKPTQVYVMDRMEKYKKHLEFKLNQVNNIIRKIETYES